MTSKPTYSSIAQSLANPISPPGSPSLSAARPSWPRAASTSATRPIWTRTRTSSIRSHSPSQLPLHTRAMRTFDRYLRRGLRLFRQLTLLQKILLIVLVGIAGVSGLILIIFNEAIFAWLEPLARQWKDVTGGWIVLWLLISVTALPPLVGYSTLVSLCGFVYGLNGWFIASTANVAGSLISFCICRAYFRNFSQRLAESDPRFAAFNLVVEHDGLPLLCAIRLCPLPYSLSNAGLSTIRSIKPLAFAIATATATPKLMLHIFVGERLAAIAREGGTMDVGTKVANYAGIIFGVVIGVVTGWVVYRRTVARAAVLQAEARRKELVRGEDRFAAQVGGSNGGVPRRHSVSGASSLAHPDAFADDEDGDENALLGSLDGDAEERDEIDFLDGGNYADESPLKEVDEESALEGAGAGAGVGRGRGRGRKNTTNRTKEATGSRVADPGGEHANESGKDENDEVDDDDDGEQDGVISLRSSMRL